jgi:hypothetical protein
VTESKLQDWQRTLLELGQQEQEREAAAKAEAERVETLKHRFLRGVAYEALKQVGNAGHLIGRSSRLNNPEAGEVSLNLARNQQPELTFEIEAVSESTALLRTLPGYGHGTALSPHQHLLREGETLADLTVERVRDAVLEVLHHRLRGNL